MESHAHAEGGRERERERERENQKKRKKKTVVELLVVDLFWPKIGGAIYQTAGILPQETTASIKFT